MNRKHPVLSLVCFVCVLPSLCGADTAGSSTKNNSGHYTSIATRPVKREDRHCCARGVLIFIVRFKPATRKYLISVKVDCSQRSHQSLSVEPNNKVLFITHVSPRKGRLLSVLTLTKYCSEGRALVTADANHRKFLQRWTQRTEFHVVMHS